MGRSFPESASIVIQDTKVRQKIKTWKLIGVSGLGGGEMPSVIWNTCIVDVIGGQWSVIGGQRVLVEVLAAELHQHLLRSFLS
jgi:hypothetical protein